MCISDMSVDEETKIEDIVENLYRRVQEETERLLKSQFEKLGIKNFSMFYLNKLVKEGDFRREIYPDDPLTLAVYKYKGEPILVVRTTNNAMGIEFDIPEIPMKFIQSSVTIDREADSMGKSEEINPQ
jgi:hypothetical protein